jgi:transcriptional regulator with PAS, ATPase and Fis domain
MKTLISWIGWLDFEKGTAIISNSSPNVDIHSKADIKFEKHILLSTGFDNNPSGKDEIKASKLFSYLKKTFKSCQFELKFLNIEDAFDYEEVYPKTEAIVEKYKNENLYVNFSIGTSTMRVIWAFLAESNKFNFKLIFGRDPQQIKTGKPQFEQIEFKLLSPEVQTIVSKPLNEKPSLTITETLKKVYSKAEIAAKYDNTNILILGNTGAGKEAIAQYIHEKSIRNKADFIAVNCAAIGDELLESRLFGHRKGSFTGASSDQVGFFEKANSGSIFLDEIGDISSRMQQSLLRVIQEQKIVRIGDTETKDIDVRIICATNKDLIKEVKNGKFRADLYYRLSEVELELPSLNDYPLTEKREIIKAIISKQEQLFNKTIRFNTETLNHLYNYSFPGNFRELEAVIKNIFIFNDDIANPNELDIILRKRTEISNSILLNDVIKEHVRKVYIMKGKHKTNAAKALGISINTFQKYLNK